MGQVGPTGFYIKVYLDVIHLFPSFCVCKYGRMEFIELGQPWILYVITTSPFYLGKLRFYVNYD